MKIFTSPRCIQIPSRPGSCTGQGCQIFSAAYGQNPDKKCQNGCFFKTLWPKLQNVLTMLIFIFMGFSNFSEEGIFFARKNLVVPKKHVLTLKQQFLP